VEGYRLIYSGFNTQLRISGFNQILYWVPMRNVFVLRCFRNSFWAEISEKITFNWVVTYWPETTYNAYNTFSECEYCEQVIFKYHTTN